MVSTVAVEKLRSAFYIEHFDHDPNGTSATDVGWRDAQGYNNFLFSFFRTIGTGTFAMDIIGNPNSDGSGTDVVIKSYSGANPDAVADQIFVELESGEISNAGALAGVAIRYLSANITFGTGTDEGVVTYLWGGGTKKTGLTANRIA